ncbi:RHS repeat domain-containing protein [Arthrobacter jiangjiafuii]|uniref:RHS repeat domain-containing protein n=1 Tax=Arthrobacter jiangjiafuii TaxID=2817475 RepID=UPI001F41E49F|nr:RHS repeat domain-containing protein [Arthrobacter jiangjiafuii]
MSWSYDADGHRTGFTDATGTTTIYVRDAVGRVKAVRNPRLGEAVFTHDAAGRLTSATAGELVQEWVYRYGYLSEHSRTDRSAPDASADMTLIGRDEDGRITGLTRAGTVTRYGYDGAGQLVAAATTPLGKTGAAATARAGLGVGVRRRRPAGPRIHPGRAPHLYLRHGGAVAVGDRCGWVPDGVRL